MGKTFLVKVIKGYNDLVLDRGVHPGEFIEVEDEERVKKLLNLSLVEIWGITHNE